MQPQTTDIVLEGRYSVGPKVWCEGGVDAHAGLDVENDEPVTIFLFPRARAASEASRGVFKQIAHKLMTLSHPSLLETLSAGVQAGIGYLVAADIEGAPLSRSGKHPTVSELLQIGPAFKELIAGLEAAHGAGFFHGRLIADRVYVAAGQAALIGVGLVQLQRALESGTRQIAAGDAARMLADRSAISAPPVKETQPWMQVAPPLRPSNAPAAAATKIGSVPPRPIAKPSIAPVAQKVGAQKIGAQKIGAQPIAAQKIAPPKVVPRKRILEDDDSAMEDDLALIKRGVLRRAFDSIFGPRVRFSER